MEKYEQSGLAQFPGDESGVREDVQYTLNDFYDVPFNCHLNTYGVICINQQFRIKLKI